MEDSSLYLAFAKAVSGPDQEIDLARVSLMIAAPEYPEVDIPHYLERLDALAERVQDLAARENGPYRVLACINYVLFHCEGFQGNEEEYYDPQNSFFNRVIERKKGIPITLSVLYMEVARRVGLAVKGVGFPGHFLVTTTCDDQEILVDSFNGGRIVSPTDLENLLDKIYHGRLKVQPEFLLPVSNKQIVQRMLNNIKAIYYSDPQDLRKCLRVVEQLLILNPIDVHQIRDRGLLRLRLKNEPGALEDFERFLELAPEAKGADIIRDKVSELRKQSRTLH
jgi:regulator of sirC expression with transglutaminase-like and TPR domain